MSRHEGRPPGTQPLLTVTEVAEVLRVSNMTVYRAIKTGEMPALRVGRSYRIRQHDLDSFLNDGMVQPDGARTDESNG